jgi:cubilin
LSTLCGNNLPPSIFSSGRDLWLRYSIPTNLFARGYDISYTTTAEGRGCGGELYNTRGTVTSPGFPSSYPQVSDCTWKLKVPSGQRIEIRFTGKSIHYKS